MGKRGRLGVFTPRAAIRLLFAVLVLAHQPIVLPVGQKLGLVLRAQLRIGDGVLGDVSVDATDLKDVGGHTLELAVHHCGLEHSFEQGYDADVARIDAAAVEVHFLPGVHHCTQPREQRRRIGPHKVIGLRFDDSTNSPERLVDSIARLGELPRLDLRVGPAFGTVDRCIGVDSSPSTLRHSLMVLCSIIPATGQ
jgi:hypothetical protein